MRLYFLHVRKCTACMESLPAAEAFARAHRDVEVVPVDLLKARWTQSWTVPGTPTWVLEVPGRQRVMYTGSLPTVRDVSRFVQRAADMMGLPVWSVSP